MPTERRLNLLVIMMEQFSAMADPAYAPSAGELPALRRVADTSLRFDRAWCNAPVCGPSRLSFLAGRLPHRVPAYDNGSLLPPHVPTFAHALTAAGYRTFMCGRMHIHGLDQYAGFEARLASEIINPLMCNPADLPAAMAAPTALPPACEDRMEPQFRPAQIHRHDPFVTEAACRFLHDHAADVQPFLLTVGYLSAHSGSRDNPALQPLYEKYLQRDLHVPRFTRDDFDRLPAHLRRLLALEHATEAVFDEQWQRRRMALYLASCEFADQQVGQVLDALRDARLEDNTAVLVTADHGESMARCGLWGKMNFLEPTQRIPLYLRVPGRRADAIAAPVSLVDVFPTLVDLGGAACDVPLDGQSLLAVARDPLAGMARPIFAEYHGYRAAGGVYAIVEANRYKYIHHAAEGCELFDLSDDPQQQRNLIDDPAFALVRERCRAQLAHHVDVPATERLVLEHNRQRAAVHAAITASPRIMARGKRRIDEYRNCVNESWWDGGAYNAVHEPTFTDHDASQAIGLPD